MYMCCYYLVCVRPSTNKEEAKERHKDIRLLAQRFVEAYVSVYVFVYLSPIPSFPFLFYRAKPVVATIIHEIGLPQKSKKIKTVAVGGVAGGDKYITKKLFIKFARDDQVCHVFLSLLFSYLSLSLSLSLSVCVCVCVADLSFVWRR